MLRGAALLALAAVFGTAPVQCGSSDGSGESVWEETPGEALYQLAEELKAEGNHEGWRRTLDYLIRRYPSSRFAVAAKQDLADAGITPSPAAPASDAVADGSK